MARLSKTTPFQIYSDNGHSTAEATKYSDETVEEEESSEKLFAWAGRKDDGFVTESDDERKETNDDGAQGDDEKNYTRTSISSFPESSYPTDHERTPMHKPFTPTYVRPSSRRMQMSSPLRNRKFGTPYSEPRGSPRSRKKDFDDNDPHEPKRFPLILLHITALPVKVTWTYQAMRETLPQHVLDNLQLLRSKLSDTVLKRGILIPHPRDDYELLEEKLLEALELQESRISKCGHYRNRHSTDSDLTTSSSTDSGVGSSVDGSDEEHCSTCHHHLRAAGSGKQKWSIKVYAANGLMRASAWSAAWSEMERVDVEIMPWIKDELRLKLDEVETQELVVAKVDREADELRINQLVEERIRLMEEDSERAREAEMSREIERIVIDEQRQFSQTAQEAPQEQTEAAKPEEPVPASEPTATELPNIYRPKDIPLSILLWNYLFLLARKPRNMAVFFLVLLVSGLMLIVEPATMSAGMAEISTVVMAKAANMGLVQDVPKMVIHEDVVLSTSDAPAKVESEVESAPNSVKEAHDNDTVTVSHSAFVSEDESLAEIMEQGQEEVQAYAEQPEGDHPAESESSTEQDPEEVQASTELFDHDRFGEVETLAEQEPEGAQADAEPVEHILSAEPEISVEQTTDSEDVADKATRPATPEMVIASVPVPALEEIDLTNPEGAQAELNEETTTPDQSEDVQIDAEIPLVPEIVEVEVDYTLVSEDEDNSVAAMSPQTELLDQCLAYPIPFESPALCSVDQQGDESFVVSTSSQVSSVEKCLPYSILSKYPAMCKMDEMADAATVASIQ